MDKLRENIIDCQPRVPDFWLSLSQHLYLIHSYLDHLLHGDLTLLHLKAVLKLWNSPFNANFQLLFAPSIPFAFCSPHDLKFLWVDPQYMFSFSSFFCLSVHPCLCFLHGLFYNFCLANYWPWVTVLFILCSHIIHHWMQPPSPLMFEWDATICRILLHRHEIHTHTHSWFHLYNRNHTAHLFSSTDKSLRILSTLKKFTELISNASRI